MIASTFFRAGYIESWGRGIEKIRESCNENGNEMAEYKVSSSEVMVIFRGRHIDINAQDDIKHTQGNTQVDTQDASLTDKAKRILIVCKEPKSRQEIAELLGYRTIKSIKEEMDELLRLGRLSMTIVDKPNSKNQKYVTVR